MPFSQIAVDSVCQWELLYCMLHTLRAHVTARRLKWYSISFLLYNKYLRRISKYCYYRVCISLYVCLFALTYLQCMSKLSHHFSVNVEYGLARSHSEDNAIFTNSGLVNDASFACDRQAMRMRRECGLCLQRLTRGSTGTKSDILDYILLEKRLNYCAFPLWTAGKNTKFRSDCIENKCQRHGLFLSYLSNVFLESY